MVEEEQLGNILRKFLIPLAIIIVILIVFTISYSAFLRVPKLGASIPSFTETTDIGSLFWSSDVSGYIYPYQEYSTPLDPTQISEYFNRKPTEFECTECSSCSATVHDNVLNKDLIDSCTQCNRCTGVLGNYRNCETCESSGGSTNCLSCTNEGSDINLCEAIKDCIKENYVTNKTCLIDTIARSQQFSISDLESLVNNCREESVKFPVSMDVEKEVCNFNPSLTTAEFDITNPTIVKSPCNGGLYGCGHYQDVDFGKEYPIFKIAGIWASGWEKGPDDNEDAILYLCLDRGDGGSGLPTSDPSTPCKPSSRSWVANDKDWDVITNGENWCDKKITGACILGEVARCKFNDCLHKDTPYSFYYSGNVRKIAGLVCRESKDNHGCGVAGAPTALDKFTVHLYLDPEYTSSLLYPRCDPSPEYFDTNKIYYDSLTTTVNSPGYTKILFGNLNYQSQRDCNFNMYLCSSNAFANSSEETTIQIYDFIKDFESKYFWKDQGNDVMKYNYAIFTLDRNYTEEEIIDAIQTGYRYWSMINYPFMINDNFTNWVDKGPGDLIPPNQFYIGHYPVSFNNDCWDDGILTNFGSGVQNSILHDCDAGGNALCSGQLKVNIAMGKLSNKGFYYPDTDTVRTVITFCSSQ